MSLETHIVEELDGLLGALRDEALTDSQMQRLDELLRTDARAMEYYLDYVSLYGNLRHYHGVKWHSRLQAMDEPLPPAPRRARILYRIAGVAAAAVLAIAAGLGGFFLQQDGAPQASAEQASDPRPNVPVGPSVAVLTRVADVKWAPGSARRSPGDALAPGRITIASGMAQVEFYCGATVVLEGPADFDVVSSQRGFFHYGKIRAHVPPQASGFTIGAPGMDVVDLGTEFGLQLGRDGVAEVHVFDGKVELVAAASLAKQELTTGRGIRIEPSGFSHEISINSYDFATPAHLVGLSGDALQERRNAWLEHSLELRTDPDVMFYATFEGQNPWDRVLRNASRNKSVPVGAVVGAQWSEGRWPGKGAMEFKRTSDRVRITVPGEYEAMTFAAWVRFDGFDRRWNSLLLTDGWDPGEPHWQVGWDGQIIMGLRLANRGVNFATTPGMLRQADLGRWVHLVTVCDPSRGRVTHYLDGVALETRMEPIGPAGLLPQELATPIRIGMAEIGNWANSEDLRNLNGRMDELVMFGRALSDQEVHSLYEAGRPNL